LMHTNNLLLDTVQCNVVDIGECTRLLVCRSPPVLKDNSIHIWSARYGDLERHSRILLNSVNREDQKTASAFRNPADTNKYLLRHGLLRIILAHYTHHKPEMVPLKTGKNGKPEMDQKGDPADVLFNLSHTGEMVLIGVTRKHLIGADIVHIDPSYQFQDTAEYMLTPAEKVCMQRIEPVLRSQIFFRIWAIKEAILKATGSTLNLMEKTDLSGMIEDVRGFPEYSMKYQNMQQSFFIWQFTCGSAHLGVIAVDTPNSL
jgi:4'-phosphopantetheinyl transferase